MCRLSAPLGFRPPLASRGARSAGLRVVQLRNIGLRRNAAADPLPLFPLPPQQHGAPLTARGGGKQEHGAKRADFLEVNLPRRLFPLRRQRGAPPPTAQVPLFPLPPQHGAPPPQGGGKQEHGADQLDFLKPNWPRKLFCSGVFWAFAARLFRAGPIWHLTAIINVLIGLIALIGM